MKTSLKTKTFGVTTCIAMMLSLVSLPVTQINAASPAPNEPTKETINNAEFIFANGVPITITAIDSNKNKVSWDGGSMEISIKANVFGGSHDSDTVLENTSVIMESGTVNAVVGGGLHTSHVKNSNVIINGGSVPSQVVGGGASSFVKDTHAWYSGDAKNSPCLVEHANVTINGGNAYSLVFGGGEGISNTNSATVTINAGDFSKAYVTAGGSNGYTGTSVLNINGGTNYKVVQSVNRGSMESAELNVTDGTINDFYLGGETPDAGVTGTIASVKANISGGLIKNIHKGTTGGTEFPKDSSALSLTYNRSFIENANDIAESFGTIANDTFDDSITGITLNKATLTVTQGAVVVVKADISHGADATEEQMKVAWTSSDEKIATIDEQGAVTALAPGKTTITATVAGHSATCVITVEKPKIDDITVPTIDPETPVKEVTAGAEKETSEIVKEEANTIVSDIISNKATTKVSEETARNVKEAIAANLEINIEITAKTVSKEEIEEEDQNKIMAILDQDAIVSQYLDLNVILKAENKSLGTINEFSKPLTFTIIVPENLKAEGRNFYVVRLHDGKAEKLGTVVNADGTLSFSTDKLSTYALVYEDKKVEEPTPTPDPKPEPTPTPQPTPTPETVVYNVVFVDNSGVVLKSEKVNANGAATAPVAPAVEGYRFVKWDTDFSKVTKDLLVKPVYEKVTATEKPTATPEKPSSDKNTPDTGDTTSAGLFTAFALLGLVSMGIIAVQRKRKQLMK